VRDLVPLGLFARVLVPAVAAGGALLLVPLPAGVLGRLLAGIGAYAGVYLALATLLGAVRPADWRLVWDWLTLRALRGSPRRDPDSR
jgi:hypothetical protein